MMCQSSTQAAQLLATHGPRPQTPSETYRLQQWYGLADEALEDALYDSQALRDVVGIDLSHESVPSATTLLKFRRLLNGSPRRRTPVWPCRSRSGAAAGGRTARSPPGRRSY